MTILKIQTNIKQDATILCYTYVSENMARSLNSWYDFDNGFFTGDLPEDAVLLVVKVKTKTGNHSLVEDTESGLKNLDHGRNPQKMGRLVPRNFPGYCPPGRMTIV